MEKLIDTYITLRALTISYVAGVLSLSHHMHIKLCQRHQV